MGSKSAAKALMAQAQVPLVPGYHGDEQDPTFLQAQADQIGYPVLIKASAGGGGKGMRLVQQSSDFIAALASCQREAQASFRNAHVLVERYVTRPRHIEIQVLATPTATTCTWASADCSVQRRHQKVLEEAPAPGMTPERRAQMGDAAIAAARSVGYVGAGAVEFICEQDGTLYFMEMNTRLQVEHPVTEAITGQDLVEWQLRVAARRAPAPRRKSQITFTGHAIEARVCAETPAQQFPTRHHPPAGAAHPRLQHLLGGPGAHRQRRARGRSHHPALRLDDRQAHRARRGPRHRTGPPRHRAWPSCTSPA